MNESLNSKINSRILRKQKRDFSALSDTQKEYAISLFLRDNNNSTSVLAKKIGATHWRVSRAISDYLSGKLKQEYLIFESKMNER
jgi:hypothetical protein